MHVPIKVKSNNISKWQMEFNMAFKGLMQLVLTAVGPYEMLLFTISLCGDQTDPGDRAV
jgi:hypothetical protein